MSVGGGRGVYPVIFELQIIGDAQVRAAFASLQGQLAQLPAAAGAAGASATNASAAINGMGAASQNLVRGISPLNTSLLASSNAMSRLSPAVSTYGGEAALAATTTTKYATTLTSSGVAAVGAAEAADRNAKAIGSMSQQQVAGLRNTTGLTLAIAGLALSGIEAGGMMQALGETQARYAVTQARVNELVAAGQEGTHSHTLAVMANERAQRNLGMTMRNTMFATTDMIIFFALIGTNLANIRAQAALAGKEFSILASIKGKLVGFGEIFTNLPAKLTAMGNATHGAAAAQTALAAKAGVLAPALGGVGAASLKNVTIMTTSTAAITANTAATLPLATNSNAAAVAQTTLGASAAKNIPIFGAQTVAQIGMGASAVTATGALRGMAVAMTTLWTRAGPLLLIFGAIAASAIALKMNLFGLQDAIIAQHKATDVAIKSASGWQKETLGMGQAANIALFNLLGIENELTEVAEATKIAEESIVGINAALDRSISDWQEFDSTVISAAAGMLEFSGNMDSINDVFAALDKGLAAGTITLEQWRAAVQQINLARGEWEHGMDAMRETTLMFTDDVEAGFTVLMAQMEKLPGALAGAPDEMQFHIDKLMESVDKMGLTVEQKFQLLSELANNTVGPSFASLDRNGQTAFTNIQTYMTDMSNTSIDTGKTFTTVANELGQGFQYVEDSAVQLVTAIDDLNNSYAEGAAALPRLAGQVFNLNTSISEQDRQLSNIAGGLEQYIKNTIGAEDATVQKAIALAMENKESAKSIELLSQYPDIAAKYIAGEEAAAQALLDEAKAAEVAVEAQIDHEAILTSLFPKLQRMAEGTVMANAALIKSDPLLQRQFEHLQSLDKEYDSARTAAESFAIAHGTSITDAVTMSDKALLKSIESFAEMEAAEVSAAEAAKKAAADFAAAWTDGLDAAETRLTNWSEKLTTAVDELFATMNEKLDADQFLDISFNEDFWDKFFPAEIAQAKFDEFDIEGMIDSIKDRIESHVSEGLITTQQAEEWFDPLISFLEDDLPADAEVAFGHVVSAAGRFEDQLRPVLVGGIIAVGGEVKAAVENDMMQPMLDAVEAAKGPLDQSFLDMMSGIVDDLKKTAPELAGFFEETLNNTNLTVDQKVQELIAKFNQIRPGFKDTVMGIDSDSDGFANVLDKDFNDPMELLKNAIVDAFEEILVKIRALPSDFEPAAADVNDSMTSIATTAEDVKERVVTAFTGTTNTVKMAFIGLKAAGITFSTDTANNLLDLAGKMDTHITTMNTSTTGFSTNLGTVATNAGTSFEDIATSATAPQLPLDETGQAGIDMGADIAAGAGEAATKVDAAAQNMNTNLMLVNDTMSTVVQSVKLWIIWAESIQGQFEHVQTFAFAPHITQMDTLLASVAEHSTGMTVAWINHAQATQTAMTNFGTALNAIYVNLMTTVTGAVVTGTTNMTIAWINHTIATKNVVTAFAAAVTASYGSFLSSLLSTVSQQTTAMTIAWINHKLATESVISQLSASITSTYASMLNSMQSNLGSQLSTMNAMWASHVSAVKSHLTALASAVSSTMNSISSSMNQAASAARELKASIDALQSKTITITTIRRTVTSGSTSGSTSGGSTSGSTSSSTTNIGGTSGAFKFTSTGGIVRAQHGFTGFFDSPTRIRVGESGKEFVNVVPMGRGRQNESALHNLVRNNTSRRSGRLVIVSPIYIDGREIARAERRYSFEGISGLT